MNKSELLNWLKEEIHNWEALLDLVGPDRMDQPGVNGNWSMKDIAAHLTGWNNRLAAHLQAALDGEPEPPPPWPAHLQTDDQVNAWIYQTNRNRSTGEVLAESRRTFDQILVVVETYPEDVQIEIIHHEGRDYYLVHLDGRRVQPGEFFDHYHDDHEQDVSAWLARI